MAMNHESTDENTREWPARAMDMQQEPAIPDDVIWPVGAEKPDKAIPKMPAGAEKLPANGDVKTTKAEAKEAAPTVVAIAEEDALSPEKVEKRPAPSASVETRKKAAAKKATGTTTTKRSGSRKA